VSQNEEAIMLSDDFVTMFGGGLAAGLAALLVLTLALQWVARTASRNINLDAAYANMDDTKRGLVTGSELDDLSRTAKLRLGAIYAVSAAVLFTLALRLVITFGIEGSTALVLLALTWLLLVGMPLALISVRRRRRLAVLEIASVLQLIARNSEVDGGSWELRSTKSILGGDLFGAEEEDRLELRLTRNQIAPIGLRTSGRITVADAGLERTVSKNALRQLRLQGWFVNEISATEVEFTRDWSLHDHSYIDIASTITWLVEALGLPVGSLRLARIEPEMPGLP